MLLEKSLTYNSNPEAPKLIVLDCVNDLKEALSDSDSDSKMVYINAAIDAYNSGEMRYTKDYTLI